MADIYYAAKHLIHTQRFKEYEKNTRIPLPKCVDSSINIKKKTTTHPTTTTYHWKVIYQSVTYSLAIKKSEVKI